MGSARMGPLIFSMALPAMISMLINALYNIVDSIFVAQYSPERAGRGFAGFSLAAIGYCDRRGNGRGRQLTDLAPFG